MEMFQIVLNIFLIVFFILFIFTSLHMLMRIQQLEEFFIEFFNLVKSIHLSKETDDDSKIN